MGEKALDITSLSRHLKVTAAKKLSEFDIALAVYLLLRGVQINPHSLRQQDQFRRIITYLYEKPEGSNKTRLELLKDKLNLITTNDSLVVTLTKIIVELSEHKLINEHDFAEAFQLVQENLNLIAAVESVSTKDLSLSSVLHISSNHNLESKDISGKEQDSNDKLVNNLSEQRVKKNKEVVCAEEPQDLLQRIKKLCEVNPQIMSRLGIMMTEQGIFIKANLVSQSQEGYLSLQKLNKEQLNILSNTLEGSWVVREMEGRNQEGQSKVSPAILAWNF